MPGADITSCTTFGSLLKHLRRRARLTQRELGIAVGYSEAHVARLESGSRLPDLLTVRSLLVPALGLEKDASLAARLVELAEASRGEVHAAALPEDASPTASPQNRPRGNLPILLTRFIGRERAIAELKALLAESRLLTLTGSGGAGKTRLALQVAEQLAPLYTDGVWFVELAPLHDAEQLSGAIASTLGYSTANRPPAQMLADNLRDKDALLILDSCEHLIASCAELAESL